MPFGQWPGADVTLQVTAARWEGLSAGRGRLRRREVTILARGRGAAARPKEVTLWMPGVTLHPPAVPPPSLGLSSVPSAAAATRPAPRPLARSTRPAAGLRARSARSTSRPTPAVAV
jgi:hypothetical protein